MMTEAELKDWLQVGLKFHGHLCGGMPMGFKAGLAGLEALGVEREPDSELMALAESGEHQLAGCWVDGIMLATGCTYGKGNVVKLFYGKWAYTLIDKRTNRAVRVAVKPEVMEKALEGPFIAARKSGILPSKVDQKLARGLFETMAQTPIEKLVDVSEVFEFEWKPPKTTFEVMRCEQCGELTVKRFMRVAEDGKRVCIPCVRNVYNYPPALLIGRGDEACKWPVPPK